MGAAEQEARPRRISEPWERAMDVFFFFLGFSSGLNWNLPVICLPVGSRNLLRVPATGRTFLRVCSRNLEKKQRNAESWNELS